MVQVCIVCNKVYGEKEPLTLREYTHGLCLECLEARLKLEKVMSLEEEFYRERKEVK